MKILLQIAFLISTIATIAQKKSAPNLVIVTIDGLRWQEVFGGIDTSIANNPKFNSGDSLSIYDMNKPAGIMPFVNNFIGTHGQLWGNRYQGSEGTVKNKYWFSYPGYNEILTGYADDSINTNKYKPNPNSTLLDFLQTQPAYKNKIAAFGAWEAFDRILNKPRAGYPIFCAFTLYQNKKSKAANTINQLNAQSHRFWDSEESHDVFVHAMAMDYLKTQKPKVLYIAYGETDEWAHSWQYKNYIRAAKNTDAFIQEIWDWLQSDKKYKDNTILLVTTDHGRGLGEKWTNHNNKIPYSNEVWCAWLGKGISHRGIITNENYTSSQLAATALKLLGFTYTAEHTVDGPMQLVTND
jgi:arylsulfatase A-like enzyme